MLLRKFAGGWMPQAWIEPCRSRVIVTSLPTSTPPDSSAAFQVRPKSSRLTTALAVAPAL